MRVPIGFQSRCIKKHCRFIPTQFFLRRVLLRAGSKRVPTGSKRVPKLCEAVSLMCTSVTAGSNWVPKPLYRETLPFKRLQHAPAPEHIHTSSSHLAPYPGRVPAKSNLNHEPALACSGWWMEDDNISAAWAVDWEFGYILGPSGEVSNFFRHDFELFWLSEVCSGLSRSTLRWI